MSLEKASTDLLVCIKNPSFIIDWQNLEVIEEILIPTEVNDYFWYSNTLDAYLPETDVYLTEKDALEVLFGQFIKIKNETILKLSKKEREIISKLSPEYENEGLIG